MTSTEMRQLLDDMYEAIASRDPERIGVFLTDDIDLTIMGPVDLLPFFGRRIGKPAVMQMYREIPQHLRYTDYVREGCLVEGDQAAVFARATATMLKTNRVITWHMAQFLRIRDSKVCQVRALYDSFHIFEQVLGHEIDVTQAG